MPECGALNVDFCIVFYCNVRNEEAKMVLHINNVRNTILELVGCMLLDEFRFGYILSLLNKVR